MDSYYGYDEAMMNGVASVLGIFLTMMVVSMVVSIVFYVLQSLGVYTIAKRRQIRNPWFAWLPIVDMYLWGCISDQYQQVAKLKNAKRRVLMLILAILHVVISTGVTGAAVGIVVEMISMINSVTTGALSEDAMVETLMTSSMGLQGLSSAVSIFNIVYMVFRYMTLHDIYASCNPENKTVFLVLSIFFGFLIPIFLFANRKRDDGMQSPSQVSYNGWGASQAPQGNWQQPYQPQQGNWQQPYQPQQGNWQQPYQPQQSNWQQPYQPQQGNWQQPYQPQQGNWQQPYQPQQNNWQQPDQSPAQPSVQPQESAPQEPAQPQEPWNSPEPPKEPWQ